MENSPHFLKILLGDVIRHGRLEIPEKFLRKYGNGLSSPVTLKVPSGATWQVELLNCDDEVWLEKGWQEFAEYHSLQCGHLLVFKYEQPCHFYVIIFDKSATEIEYPCARICTADRNLDEELKEPKVEENEDNSSVEILNYPSSNLKRGGETLRPCPLSPKKMRTVAANKTTDTAVSNHDSPSSGSTIGNPYSSMRDFGGNFNKGLSKENSFLKAIRGSCPRTSKAHEAANKYISKYPSFKSVVNVECLRRCTVVIPNSFSREHFWHKVEDLTLRVADRCWHMRLLNYYDKRLTKFGAGWTAFERGNSLKKGDVCVFELIESRVLNVCIFRCSD
ncbi:hypothetical protein JCGZ_12309 [Jatropha curcas]|uniref:TF-B3 domain-containing protein n=1 Tax=Jatropha curcas TaxID=180498 RepID=A0A067KA42_JATCU|nr:B3 domain-containing transcription factor VRN1 [Jatropha curcas]KDP31848.1 hypothetical protein JCGZ_12309 [Jatropha curcas]